MKNKSLNVADKLRLILGVKFGFKRALEQFDNIGVKQFPESVQAEITYHLNALKAVKFPNSEDPDNEILSILLSQKKAKPGVFESEIEKTHLELIKVDENKVLHYVANLFALSKGQLVNFKFNAFFINDMGFLKDNKFVVVTNELVIIYCLDNSEYLTLENFEEILSNEDFDDVAIFIESLKSKEMMEALMI